MGNELFQNRDHDINENPDENAPGTMGCFDRNAMARRPDRYGIGARISGSFRDVKYDGNEILLGYEGDYQSPNSHIMDSLQHQDPSNPFINSHTSISPSQDQLSQVLKNFTGQETIASETTLGKDTTWAKLVQNAILGKLSPDQIAQVLSDPDFKTREENHIKFKTEYNRQLQLAETRMNAIGEAFALEPRQIDTVYRVLNSIQDSQEGDLIRDAFNKHLQERGAQEQTFDEYIKHELEAHFRKKENIEKDSELPKNTKDHINHTVAMLNGFDPAKATQQLTEALSQLPSSYRESGVGDYAFGAGGGLAIGALYQLHQRGLSLAGGAQGLGMGLLGGTVITGVIRDWQAAGDDTWYREVQRITAGLSEEQKNQIREHYEGLDLIAEERQTEIKESLGAIEAQSTVTKESINKVAEETLDKLQDKQGGETLTPEQKQIMVAELALKLQSDIEVEDAKNPVLSAKDVFDLKINELLEEQHKREQAEWATTLDSVAEKEREEWKKTNPEPTLVDFYSLVAEKIGPDYSSSDVEKRFTGTFDPAAFAALVISETESRTRALAQIETDIGVIDSKKVEEADKRLEAIQKGEKLTTEDEENRYLQRAILLEEVKNLPNAIHAILGAHAEAHFSEISLSQDQIEAIKESLTQQLSTHKGISTNLDFTIEDRVRPRTIYDREFPPGIPIAIVTQWKDTHGTPVGSTLRDPKKSPELYSDTLP